jgi:hypothetical protein
MGRTPTLKFDASLSLKKVGLVVFACKEVLHTINNLDLIKLRDLLCLILSREL